MTPWWPLEPGLARVRVQFMVLRHIMALFHFLPTGQIQHVSMSGLSRVE